MSYYSKSGRFFYLLLLCTSIFLFQSCSKEEDVPSKPDLTSDFVLSVDRPNSFLRGSETLKISISSEKELSFDMNEVTLTNGSTTLETSLTNNSDSYAIEFDSKQLEEGFQQLSLEVILKSDDLDENISLKEVFEVEVDNYLPVYQYLSGYVDNLGVHEEENEVEDEDYYLNYQYDYEKQVYFADDKKNPISEVYDVSTFNDKIKIEIPESNESQNFFFVDATRRKIEYRSNPDNYSATLSTLLTYNNITSADLEEQIYGGEVNSNDIKIVIKVANAVIDNSILSRNFVDPKTEGDYTYYDIVSVGLNFHNIITDVYTIYSNDYSKGISILPILYSDNTEIVIEESDLKDAIQSGYYDISQFFPSTFGVIDLNGEEVYYSNFIRKNTSEGVISYVYLPKDSEIKTFSLSKFVVDYDNFMDYYSTILSNTLMIDWSRTDFITNINHELYQKDGIYSITRKDFMYDEDLLILEGIFNTGMEGKFTLSSNVIIKSAPGDSAVELDISSGIKANEVFNKHFENISSNSINRIISTYERNSIPRKEGYYRINENLQLN
ncbi:hypothetical protein KMW28_20075 [Flammeovirga yaeyamensis]|uniref:Uncharacterized protein n=1 Tax=Flammeovirga yaeyamensis TaxID=367791 RepID=A0AAX1N2U4_9BACT|nr:hypothetical protein [Flammeovirga yaeyamensis]MBB3701035.1 hypothetical protein [Flammeovirga yaeyamensis]NMF38132.1 hypothetical protein [Flammeovirga yaeyamensis]QWG01903.1 hypothetical protein KMW28_20075 [Flammeovirga yaeyamensis]